MSRFFFTSTSSRLRFAATMPAILLAWAAWLTSAAWPGAAVAQDSKEKTLRLNDVQSGHIRCLAFLPGGKMLVSGSAELESREGKLVLWDLTTGMQKREFARRKPKASPAAKKTKKQSNSTEKPPQPEKKQENSVDKNELQRSAHTDWIWTLSVSPDGKTVASGGWDFAVKLWDVEKGQQKKTLKGHINRVYCVAFSPDGKTLASASRDRSIRIWNAETGETQMRLLGHAGSVRCLAFSPDGKTLASGSDDRTVRLWDLETGKERLILEGHTGSIWALAFSPDQKTLASASADWTVVLWDMTTGKKQKDGDKINKKREIGQKRKTLTDHKNWVYALAFSPDGKALASASYDETIKIWNMTAIDEGPRTLAGHQGAVHCIAFSHDGKTLASGGSDRRIIRWNAGDEYQRQD